MPKYHVGQLMEVIFSPWYPQFIGERFTIIKIEENVRLETGTVPVAYLTEFLRRNDEGLWAREDYIKPVDLDDEVDDTTFEEFMDELAKDLVTNK